MTATSKKPSIVITAMGHYHPENNIPNSFFDGLDIDSDANWVLERTGIESRRSVLNAEEIVALRHNQITLHQLRKEGRIRPLADLAGHAWETLKGRSTPEAIENIDMLICGTSVPDFDIPANACSVAAKIGVECLSFDVNSACSSFVTNLHVARGMLQSGTHRKAAIFNPERYSLRMDYRDKRTCILFGDGCSTALLDTEEGAKGLQLIDTVLHSEPSKFDLITIPVDGFFDQNGKAVQKFAITRTIDVTKEILERNGLTPADLTYFTGHQANLRMVASAADRLGLREDQHLFNVDKLGNQGAAGAPAVLSMNWTKFRPGDIVAIAVVGSGLTWGAALFRCV